MLGGSEGGEGLWRAREGGRRCHDLRGLCTQYGCKGHMHETFPLLLQSVALQGSSSASSLGCRSCQKVCSPGLRLTSSFAQLLQTPCNDYAKYAALSHCRAKTVSPSDLSWKSERGHLKASYFSISSSALRVVYSSAELSYLLCSVCDPCDTCLCGYRAV